MHRVVQCLVKGYGLGILGWLICSVCELWCGFRPYSLSKDVVDSCTFHNGEKNHHFIIIFPHLKKFPLPLHFPLKWHWKSRVSWTNRGPSGRVDVYIYFIWVSIAYLQITLNDCFYSLVELWDLCKVKCKWPLYKGRKWGNEKNISVRGNNENKRKSIQKRASQIKLTKCIVSEDELLQ